MSRYTLLSVIAFLFFPLSLSAQDTVRVSLQSFLEQGIEKSGQLDFEEQGIHLAENEVNQANATRYLPNFEFNSQHGVVPGVDSDVPDLNPNEYYLDPNLENDWNNWAVFTRAEISAVQPVFTWGALRNAVKAAESAAIAAREQFNGEQQDLRKRLFDLYQSHLLTSEILRLLEEAEDQMDTIEEQIKQKQEEGDADFDDSEVFKFEIFKSEFAMRAEEVRQNAQMTQRLWNYILEADENTIFIPEEQFLDPVPQQIQEIDYYKSFAISNRSEMKAIDAGIDAAEYGVKAEKRRNYPSLFLGVSGSFANTPNRPRQSNPFIINNTNYLSAQVGFGIRQNLDFLSIRADIERRQIQSRQAKYLKEAAVDGIVLELNEIYKQTAVSKVRVERTDEALVTSKKWLRQEQLDYDFGIGETRDLIEAVQNEFELRVQLRQEIFEFNQNMAELYRTAGLPITDIMNEDQ